MLTNPGVFAGQLAQLRQQLRSCHDLRPEGQRGQAAAREPVPLDLWVSASHRGVREFATSTTRCPFLPRRPQPLMRRRLQLQHPALHNLQPVVLLQVLDRRLSGCTSAHTRSRWLGQRAARRRPSPVHSVLQQSRCSSGARIHGVFVTGSSHEPARSPILAHAQR